MKHVIWFSVIWQSTLIQIMRTLWATTTGNAGPGMLAWGSWSMTLILAVLCSGTSRTACLDLSQHSAGMKALCLSTAKTIQIFFSTCVALNAAFCPSAAQRLKNSLIGMVYGTCKMRYMCRIICIDCSASYLYPWLNRDSWRSWKCWKVIEYIIIIYSINWSYFSFLAWKIIEFKWGLWKVMESNVLSENKKAKCWKTGDVTEELETDINFSRNKHKHSFLTS